MVAMKKILTSLLLLFIVSAMLFSIVKIEPAHAISTVETSGWTNSVWYNFQKKTFWIQSTSRWWAFYYNHAYNFGWRTSTDGSSWSSFTILFADNDALDFWYDNTTDKICVALPDDTVGVYYRQGTPNSSGLITWDSDWVLVCSDDPCMPRMLKDSDGYPWISYFDTDNYELNVVKASTTSGSSWGTPTTLWTSGMYYQPTIIVPLMEGKLLAIGSKTASPLESRLYNGSLWESAVTTSFYPHDEDRLDAVADGDNVHLAFLNATSLDIVYAKYVYGSGWGSVETVQASTISLLHPSITLMSADRVRVFFFEDTYSIKYRDRISGSWEDAVYISQGESGVYCMSSSYMAFSGKFSVLWNSGFPTADDVMFEGMFEALTFQVQVTSSPEINADYTINGTSHQTPHDETDLDAGSYNFTVTTINKTVSGVDYDFEHWLINGATEDTDLSILLSVSADSTLSIHYQTVNHFNVSFNSEPSGLFSVHFSAEGSWHWSPQSLTLHQGLQSFLIESGSLIRIVNDTWIYGFDHWSITNTTGTFNSTGSSVNYNLQENSSVIMAYTTIRIQVAASPALPVYFSSEYYGSNYSVPKTLNWNSGSHTFTALTYTYSPNTTYLYTFDHWLVNGTDQYGSLGITLSFTADTNLTIVYVGSTLTPPYPYIYVSGALNATWYFRSDTWTVHSILGYKLQTVNTATPAFDERIDAATKNVSYGVRVWALDLFGNQRELTSGTPAAIATKTTEGSEMMLAYWTCPAYGSMIDSIKVNLYQQFNDEGWSLRRIYVTGSDLLIRLPSASWTFHYYVNRTVGSTYSTFGFGSYTTYNSRIDLPYYKASPWDLALARLWQRNFVGFLFAPWTYWFGDLFWSIILFGCIIMAWMRTGSFKPVLALLWIIGGSGSILWALIPASALHVAVLMLALAMAITLFRLIYGRRT